jgi:hypothetical protein
LDGFYEILTAALRELNQDVPDQERIDRLSCLEERTAAIAAARARETVAFVESQRAQRRAARVAADRLDRGLAGQVGLARRISPHQVWPFGRRAGAQHRGNIARVDDDLYRMLGLPREASVDRVRQAYEAAVAAATRNENWRLAADLSRAFDRLPASRRSAVYDGRPAVASRHGGRPIAIGWGVQDTQRHRGVLRSALGWVLAIVLLVAGGFGAWVKYGHHTAARTGPPPVPPMQSPIEAIPTPQGNPAGTVRVPIDLTAGADGYVVAVCARTDGVELTARVLPGVIMARCPDGAVPGFRNG